MNNIQNLHVYDAKEIPANLNNHAWAGNLFNMVIAKYRDLVIIYAGITFILGIIASVVMWFLGQHWFYLQQNPFPFWTLGMMIWLWSFIGIPVVYQLFLTKKAWFVRLDENGEFFLDWNKWFKRDYGKFNLNEGKYEKFI